MLLLLETNYLFLEEVMENIFLMIFEILIFNKKNGNKFPLKMHQELYLFIFMLINNLLISLDKELLYYLIRNIYYFLEELKI